MLLTSVIIVLREVLEAALLISVLSALRHILGGGRKELLLGLVAGLTSSVILARSMGVISEFADGVGQELLLAMMHLAIYICLLAIGIAFLAPPVEGRPALPILMAFTVAVAVSREGAEICLYLSAFLQQPEARDSVLHGSLIGLGIGVSAGALLYYALCLLPSVAGRWVVTSLLVVVAGAMAIQAAGLLIQADFLPDGRAWDTSGWLSEEGVAGQLLYALVGYEATPAPAQLWVYSCAVIMMGAALIWQRHRSRRLV